MISIKVFKLQIDEHVKRQDLEGSEKIFRERFEKQFVKEKQDRLKKLYKKSNWETIE